MRALKEREISIMELNTNSILKSQGEYKIENAGS